MPDITPFSWALKILLTCLLAFNFNLTQHIVCMAEEERITLVHKVWVVTYSDIEGQNEYVDSSFE